MAAFIVISADNRLHFLVDGIEKYRPLNSSVCTQLSTGKIKKSETGYIYNYTIHGEVGNNDGAKSFCDLLSNQLAAFRLAYAIPHGELLNIFFLENPLTEKELEESESWLEDFEKVFNAGLGHDTNFCLFRIVFTYNLEKPNDVSAQIDKHVLERLLAKHQDAISFNSKENVKPSFERYLFYIDNQKSDSAALCLNKDEHDLKMPRLLIDFMMLVSNSFDKYNIMAAIHPASIMTRCFSVGYAESMYYYPDVERYYIHADNRDIHYKFLFSDDECSKEIGARAMNVEKYPFGLLSRRNRLSEIYEDVPFTDKIANYPESADYKIDYCIICLRELLEQERKKEIEDFEKSSDVTRLKENIKTYEMQIESASQADNESPEEFNDRVTQLSSVKEDTERQLEQLIKCFEPECPVFLDRNDIYDELCIREAEELDNLLDLLSDQYNRLINFAKTKKFHDFIKSIKMDGPQESSEYCSKNKTETLELKKLSNNSGCLPQWFIFWKKRSKVELDDNILKIEDSSSSNKIKGTKSEIFKIIADIKEQLDLKKTFDRFKKSVYDIENVYGKEKEFCETFSLTTHTNHYFPLINLKALIKTHNNSSEKRIQESIDSWRLNHDLGKVDLVKAIKDEVTKHTKSNYSFIDWNNPFPFITEILEEEILPRICNELQKRAAPIVNYNLTSEIKDNRVSRYFFSDRPQFKEEIEIIRHKLNNGNEVSAIKSIHIASKICMFQFLPMDEDVLQNLVDRKH